MESLTELADSVREVWLSLCADAASGTRGIDRLELFGTAHSARIQIEYSARGGRFGVGEDIPDFESRDDGVQFLEGFFYDRLVEPSDTTRGLWVDGVWWWTPGTAPIERPRVDGLLLVADGRWVWAP